jgi:hypothetical protein
MYADVSFSVHELEIGAVNELLFTKRAVHFAIYVRLQVERRSVPIAGLRFRLWSSDMTPYSPAFLFGGPGLFPGHV